MISALIGRFFALHDNHKRIAAGAVAVGLLTFIAKLFVVMRELAIAWRFGISDVVDSYQLAVTVTTWLPMLLSSTMTVVLVPSLVRLRSGGQARAFIDELNGTLLFLGIAVMALIWVAAPAFSQFLASHGNGRILGMTLSMSRQMAPIGAFLLLSGYLSVRLQARQNFVYSVTDAVPALTIALAMVLPLALRGGAPLVFGTLLGFFLQLLVLILLVSKRDAPLGTAKFRHRSGEWSALYGALFVMIGGQIALALAGPIDQAFAARLGAGSVATMGYANRIVSLFTSAGAVVLARALLPVFSAAAGADDPKLGLRQARQWAWLLFACGSIVALVGWGAATPIVALVFERGAFGAADTLAVARVLRPALLQVPFYFGGLALVQWIAASGRYRALLWIACVAIAVKIAMNFLLVRALGLAGIMASTAAMYASSAALQYWYLRERK